MFRAQRKFLEPATATDGGGGQLSIWQSVVVCVREMVHGPVAATAATKKNEKMFMFTFPGSSCTFQVTLRPTKIFWPTISLLVSGRHQLLRSISSLGYSAHISHVIRQAKFYIISCDFSLFWRSSCTSATSTAS